MTTLTIMRQLPREVDPLVFNMSMEDPGEVNYSSVGGLPEQIRELREVRWWISCVQYVLHGISLWLDSVIADLILEGILVFQPPRLHELCAHNTHVHIHTFTHTHTACTLTHTHRLLNSPYWTPSCLVVLESLLQKVAFFTGLQELVKLSLLELSLSNLMQIFSK